MLEKTYRQAVSEAQLTWYGLAMTFPILSLWSAKLCSRKEAVQHSSEACLEAQKTNNITIYNNYPGLLRKLHNRLEKNAYDGNPTRSQHIMTAVIATRVKTWIFFKVFQRWLIMRTNMSDICHR